MAHAQRSRREASFEAGYSRVHQEGFAASDAGSLAAMLACTTPTRALEAAGSVLFAPGGGAIGHGMLSGTQRLWGARSFGLDLGGTASTIVSTDLPSASTGSLLGRASYDVGTSAVWGSAEGMLLSHDAPVRGSAVVEGGLVRRVSIRPTTTFRIGGTLSHTWTHRDVAAFSADVADVAIRYGEVGGFSELRGRLGTLSLSGGARFGEEGRDDGQAFIAAEAEWRVTPAFAISVAGGSQLADPTRGVGAAEYTTLAIRLSGRSRATPPPAPGSAVRVAVERDSSDLVVVRVSAPMASRVDVMGDFSDWDPIALERRDGEWQMTRAIPPGSHRLLVRIDGGPWRPPGNLPTIADDFGGRVGLLVVP
jgi:hypothetical protein